MADFLGGLLGGDPYDLYGDILSDKQRAALQGRGLLSMAGAFAEAAKPSLLPTGGIGRALGMAASALGEGQDKSAVSAMNAALTAQKIKQAQREQALYAQIAPYLLAKLKKAQDEENTPPGLPGAPSTASPTTVAPTTTAPGGSAPPGTTINDRWLPSQFGVPRQNLSGYGLPARPGALPPEIFPQAPPGFEQLPGGGLRAVPDSASPPGAKLTSAEDPYAGLLADGSGGGAPDEVIGRGPGVLSSILASFGGGGQQGGGLPFRLASAANSSNGPAGDILDTVEKYESGGRNIHQGVVSPAVSSAQGYYQITNSTWRDVAPKAGVDLQEYPTAMTAPKGVQRAVAEQLYAERGAQPWADFNPALAKAIGWQGASNRGERPADVSLGGSGGGVDALGLLAQMARPPGDTEDGSDPLASLAALETTGGGKGGDLPLQLATARLAPYAVGNAVLGGRSSVEGVSPTMSGRIEAMVSAMPPDVRERFLITSGFRDAQRQAEVNPGVTNSRHMHGMAVDLAKDPFVLDWINKNPQYGLGFPLQSDPREVNHLEMIDPASGGRLPLMQAQYVPGGGTAPGIPAMPAIPRGRGILGMKPEELATLNALTEMAGLKTPFSSLLETYYKTPEYLREAAGAAASGQYPFELGKIYEKGGVDAILQAQRGRIERENKTAEQEGAARLDPSSQKWPVVVNGQLLEIPLTRKQFADAASGKGVPELGIAARSEVAPSAPEIALPEVPRYSRALEPGAPMPQASPGAPSAPPPSGPQFGVPAAKLPDNYQWVPKPGGGFRAEPITGTLPATAETERQSAKEVGGNIMTEDIGRALGMSGFWSTGPIGGVSQYVFGTPGYKLGQMLVGIKSRTGIDQINQMRQQSASGGALGQVTEGEHKLVQSMLGNLEQAQDRGDFEYNLKRLNNTYLDAVYGTTDRLNQAVADGKITPAQRDRILAQKQSQQYDLSAGPPGTVVRPGGAQPPGTAQRPQSAAQPPQIPMVKMRNGKQYFSTDNGNSWWTE